MRKLKWKLPMGIAASIAVIGGVVGATGIASADPTAQSKTFVDGFGTLTDDFSDNADEAGVLCEGCENSNDTDLVLLWQSVLAADGYLGPDQVDGDFGEDTAAATGYWQEDRGLEADGEVGDETWTTADDKLVWEDEDVVYTGEVDGSIHMGRAEGDGGYALYTVTTADSLELFNNGDSDHIMFFEETIFLEAN